MYTKYFNYTKEFLLLIISNTRFSKLKITIEDEKNKYEWSMPRLLICDVD